MKKAIWIASILPLIITAFLLRFLPDSVPMHYDLSGQIDRWGSKNENLIFPLFIFAMALGHMLQPVPIRPFHPLILQRSPAFPEGYSF